MKRVHAPCVAGMFYPADTRDLRAILNECLGLSNQEGARAVVSPPRALIAPHAGYIYSGKTAGRAYQSLLGSEIKKVILLGPTHRVYYQGFALHEADSFQTPLGEIPVDIELREKLRSRYGDLNFASHVYQMEHSLEVHLPFLQEALEAGFQILPILIGDVSIGQMDQLSEAIREIIKQDSDQILLVASTDFSHFHKEDDARALDFEGKKWILENQPTSLLKANYEGKTALCGINPVYTALSALPESKVSFLDYSHSGEVTGDYSSVVGYMSFRVD